MKRPAMMLLLITVPALLPVGARSQSSGSGELEISEGVRQQLVAMYAEKASANEAQAKLGTRLRWAVRRLQADPVMNGIAASRSPVNTRSDGTTRVTINGRVSSDLLEAVEALGGTVRASFEEYGVVDARLPLQALEQIAARADVRAVREPDRTVPRPSSFVLARPTSDRGVRRTLLGDVAHRVDQARQVFGVDRTGVKACVLSTGVDSLDEVQSAGFLPEVAILNDDRGEGDEGTAMLEIIHDLAPGAALTFATALPSAVNMADNIRDLERSSCDLIVDDVAYFNEPTFQDGIIAQAIDKVVARGVTYFSATGNLGNRNDGTSSVWEGDFNPSGMTIPGIDAVLHDFNPKKKDDPTQQAQGRRPGGLSVLGGSARRRGQRPRRNAPSARQTGASNAR